MLGTLPLRLSAPGPVVWVAAALAGLQDWQQGQSGTQNFPSPLVGAMEEARHAVTPPAKDRKS